MSLRNIPQIVFVYMMIVQTASLFIGPDLDTILILKFTYFEIGVISGVILLIINLNEQIRNFGADNNKYIIIILGFLFIYQVVVVSPLLYIENETIKEILYGIFRRSFPLTILFFYWCLMPSFQNLNISFKLIQLTGLVLIILLIYNYLQGKYEYTSTGQLRLASGATTLLFAFILITSFSFFSSGSNNLFFSLIAITGLVFANHKSAYLAIVIITVITLLNSKRLKNKNKMILQFLLFIFVIIVPLSQIPLLRDNFIGRISSSFTSKDPNADSRFEQYQMAWNYFLENPINGSMLNHRFYKNPNQDVVPPHSFIFQLLSTQGIVGFTLIMIVIMYLLRMGYINRRDPLSFQMFLFIIFYLVVTALNENFYSSRNILLLDFSAAIILYRNKCINNAKDFLFPLILKKMWLEHTKDIIKKTPVYKLEWLPVIGTKKFERQNSW